MWLWGGWMIIGTRLSGTSDIGECRHGNCMILKTTPAPAKESVCCCTDYRAALSLRPWDFWIHPPHSTCQKKLYLCGFVRSVGNYNLYFITILCCVTKNIHASWFHVSEPRTSSVDTVQAFSAYFLSGIGSTESHLNQEDTFYYSPLTKLCMCEH